MNVSSQNGVIWCILGVLFLRFMCPMDCSCMINFIDENDSDLRCSEVSLKGKKIKTLVKILGGRDPCNPCGVDAYASINTTVC